MTRYLRFPYFAAAPMPALDESEAKRSGQYIEEVGDEMRRYLCVVDHKVAWVIYRDWADPLPALADARVRKEGERVEVFSPVEYDADGSHRWRVCHADARGNVEKYLEPEFDKDGRILREGYRDASGQLRSYQQYTYDERGDVAEVVTRLPDGTLHNVDYDG